MAALTQTAAPHSGTAPLGRAARDARWRRLVMRYQRGDRAAGEQLVADLVNAAEDMGEAAADAGAEAVDDMGEFVEEGAEVVGEAIDTVVGWFS